MTRLGSCNQISAGPELEQRDSDSQTGTVFFHAVAELAFSPLSLPSSSFPYLREVALASHQVPRPEGWVLSLALIKHEDPLSLPPKYTLHPSCFSPFPLLPPKSRCSGFLTTLWSHHGPTSLFDPVLYLSPPHSSLSAPSICHFPLLWRTLSMPFHLSGILSPCLFLVFIPTNLWGLRTVLVCFKCYVSVSYCDFYSYHLSPNVTFLRNPSQFRSSCNSPS